MVPPCAELHRASPAMPKNWASFSERHHIFYISGLAQSVLRSFRPGDSFRGPDRGAMALNEMTAEDGSVRRPYERVAEWLSTVSPEQLERRRVEAELFYRRGGITFAVYGDAQGEERIIPYDIIPRILSTQEWSKLSAGLEQ